MIEYRGKVFVGLENKTWYEVDCTYLAASDEGDVRAIEAMEHQVLNSLPAGQLSQVAFVLFSPTTLEIIEEVEDDEVIYIEDDEDFYGWYWGDEEDYDE